MAQRKTASSPLAVILIAPGYDELAIATCVSELRRAGLAVSIVSTAAGLISSVHGLTIRPDELIERRATGPLPRLLIIPGFAGCAEMLLADPRVHRLIAKTRAAGGTVAVLSGAQAAVAQAEPTLGAQVQDDAGLSTFLRRLMEQTLE